MKYRTSSIMITTLAIAGGCLSMPERMEFSRSLYGLPSDVDCGDINHQLWSMHCDLTSFATTYFHKSRSSARRVSLLDGASLATTLGVGGIVALGGAADGTLSSGKLNTAENLTFGGAALSAGRQLYNPDGIRDTNLRAYYAFNCASVATLLSLQREAHVRTSVQLASQTVDLRKQVEEDLANLIARREEMDSDMSLSIDAEVRQDIDSIETAAESISSMSLQAEERAQQNAGAYAILPFRIMETRDEIYRQVLERGVSNSNSVGSAYQAFQSTLQNQQQFLSSSAQFTSPTTIGLFARAGGSNPTAGIGEESGETGVGFSLDPAQARSREYEQLVRVEIESLERNLALLKKQAETLDAATPNIVTISSHLDQCASIVSTGLVVATPELNDSGPTVPPSLSGEMFDASELSG